MNDQPSNFTAALAPSTTPRGGSVTTLVDFIGCRLDALRDVDQLERLALAGLRRVGVPLCSMLGTGALRVFHVEQCVTVDVTAPASVDVGAALAGLAAVLSPAVTTAHRWHRSAPGHAWDDTVRPELLAQRERESAEHEHAQFVERLAVAAREDAERNASAGPCAHCGGIAGVHSVYCAGVCSHCGRSGGTHAGDCHGVDVRPGKTVPPLPAPSSRDVDALMRGDIDVPFPFGALDAWLGVKAVTVEPAVSRGTARLTTGRSRVYVMTESAPGVPSAAAEQLVRSALGSEHAAGRVRTLQDASPVAGAAVEPLDVAEPFRQAGEAWSKLGEQMAEIIRRASRTDVAGAARREPATVAPDALSEPAEPPQPGSGVAAYGAALTGFGTGTR